MKTLRFAALSLMLLLSAGAFAQITRITNGDTLIIEFGIDPSQPKDCNLYPGETNCNHLRVDGNGNGSVTCFMGFKSITVNKGTVANEYEYTTDSVEIIVNQNAEFHNYKNISSGKITVNGDNAKFYNRKDILSGKITINRFAEFYNYNKISSDTITINNAKFYNYNKISSDKITINIGAFTNDSVISTIESDIVVDSGSFYNMKGTVNGKIEIKRGQFVNEASIENTPIKLTGGEFANRQDIDDRSSIVVEGGEFSNTYSGGNAVVLPASITVNGGRFNNGVGLNCANFIVTGEITVKSGEFHNWGIVNPCIDNIKLNGGEFVNEPSGKVTPDTYGIFIDGGTFTNKGNITSSLREDISIYDGELVNDTNATITGVLLSSYGKLTNNGTITLNSKDSTSITVYAAGAITNNGIIDGKGMVISHGGECINAEGASIKQACMEYDGYNQGDNAFINNGTIDSLSVSYGMFTNNGTVRKVFVSGNDYGSGTFTNEANGTITDSIALNNRGGFTNKGRISLGKIIEVAGSTFTNYGTLSSFVDCKTGGTFIWGEGASSDKNIGFDSSSTFILKSGIVLDYLNPQILNFSYKPKVVIEEGAELKNYFSDLILRKRIEAGRWNFMGLGMNTDLQAFSGVATEENAMYALAYNYTTNNWDDNYLYINTASIPRGEGILVYAEKDTYVDFADSLRRMTDSVITVSKENTITQRTDEGNWLAMANPYASPIAVSTITSQLPQGKCVYLYDGTTWTTIGSGDETTRKINQYEGFFVNIATDSTKEIKLWNPNFKGYNPAEEEEHKDDEEEEYEEELEGDPTGFDGDLFVCSFLTVSVSTDGYKVPVSFAQNDAAMAGYDIFDANKLFGNGTVAEPYLVCNGVNLCKEEVNEASYAATMNIRSSEARSVEIAADIVPEGYSLVLKDGETETPMNQGDIYTTDIASGENAERFKLLINKNNVSLDELAATEKPRVSSINRNIIIEGGERVRTEVFNTLGQKVYETTKRNFTLNDLEAGAYVLRVQSTSGMQSSKIVIR